MNDACGIIVEKEKGIALDQLKVGDTFITNYSDEPGVLWEVTKVASSLRCRSLTIATSGGRMERTFSYCFEAGYHFAFLGLSTLPEW